MIYSCSAWGTIKRLEKRFSSYFTDEKKRKQKKDFTPRLNFHIFARFTKNLQNLKKRLIFMPYTTYER